jgi:hypothetical protein
VVAESPALEIYAFFDREGTNASGWEKCADDLAAELRLVRRVLTQLSEWDMLDACADGGWARLLIANALKGTG